MRSDYNEREKIKIHCTYNVFVCDGEVQIGTGNHITHQRSFEPEENQAKKRKMTDLESEGDKLPDDARKVVARSFQQ